MRENASDAITFALLNHRGEALVAKVAFTERLKQIFCLGGLSVLVVCLEIHDYAPPHTHI